MKKKLVVTTLAASLVAGSFAGLPLSQQGLASKLGVSVASASTVKSNKDLLLEKFNGLHAELAKDQAGIAAVRAARDAVKALSATNNKAKKEELVTEVWNRISGKVGSAVTREELYILLSHLAINYNAEASDLTDAIENPVLRDIVDRLASALGLSAAMDKVSSEDLFDFFQEVVAALETHAEDIIQAALLDDSSFSKTKEAIKNIINEHVLESDVLKLAKLVKALGITIDDINAVQDRFSALADPEGKAQAAMESATIRYLFAATEDSGLTTKPSEDGRSLEPELTFKGINITKLIRWEVEGSQVSYNGTHFVLASSVTTETKAIVKGFDILLGKLIYIGELTFTPKVDSKPDPDPNPNPNPDPDPVGPGPGPGKSDPEDGKTVEELQEELGNLIKDLDKLPAGEKLAKVDQAVSKSQEVIAKISTVDLSAAITITGDKASPKLDVADLTKKLGEISKQAKALNEQLQKLDPSAKIKKVEFTLNLGDVKAKTIEVPLPKELLQATKDNGVTSIAIAMNGVSIAVSPNEFGADTTLAVTKEDSSIAKAATDKPLASDVYEFAFTSGGSKVTKFSTPVDLSLPVNSGGFDKELLTLAKIDNGSIIIYAGKFKDGKVTGKRDSFSMYTVVENKISFNDTASVQSWAGRQIAVAASKGIIEGRADQQFAPNEQVTRAEFAKLIVKTFALEDASAAESFDDVNDSDWYKVYVASAVKHGIVNGRSEGQFDPSGFITRAEMATMAARALLLTGSTRSVADANAELKGFKDADAIHASMKAEVALAAKEGIVIGEEGQVFNPNADSSRAEAAVVIYRLLNK